MISMSYHCPRCRWQSHDLNAAQDHSNRTFHHVEIRGFLSPNQVLRSKDSEEIGDAARVRAKEAAILRAARDKNLMRQK